MSENSTPATLDFLVIARPEDRRRLPPGAERLIVSVRCDVCHAAYIASRDTLDETRDQADGLGMRVRVVCHGCYQMPSVALLYAPRDPALERLARRADAERN